VRRLPWSSCATLAAVIVAALITACGGPIVVDPMPSAAATFEATRALATPNLLEQAVLVHLKLSDDAFGQAGESSAIIDLGDSLTGRVEGVGEYDGNEIGAGWATLFLYGPDADRLADRVLPFIRSYGPRPGSYLVRRYGPPGALEVREDLP
jgi:hypothetical protein